jgi:hypothetical protein
MFKKSIQTAILFSTGLSAFANVSQSVSLVERQWGLKNNGVEYTRKDGEYTRQIVKGTPGFDINLPKNMDVLASQSKEVVVAVIDTGVDINHPDLKERIWESPNCKGKTEEERKDLVCNGLNVLDSNGDISDTVGHGTHIAGVIASVANGFGTSGVTHSKIKVMPMKAARKKFKGYTVNGKLTSELMASSVMYALRNGAKVINLSLGYPKVVVSPKVKATFDYAIKNGVVIVAAAGNNNKNKPVFPCNFPGVICVGAMDAAGKKLTSSNFGHKVDIYAPGENIISTIPVGLESQIIRVNGYDARNGTSHAAPYIAGLAALIKAENPDMPVAEVTKRILGNAKIVKGEDGYNYPFVDFKASIENKQVTTPLLDVKAIDEVTVDTNGKFSLELPISSANVDFKYSVKSLNKDIELTNTTGSIETKEDTKAIKLEGHVKNLLTKADSSIVVTIEQNGQKVDKRIDLDLNMVSVADTKTPVLGLPSKAIMRITKHYKRSSLQRVLERNSEKSSQDFFFANPSKKNEIFLLREEANKLVPTKLKLEKASEISAIIKMDVNFDGEKDYFVYGATEDKRKYFFAYFDKDGKPIFKKNYWLLPSTRFGGLAFVRGFEKFSYLKVKTEDFGEFLTPVLVREWDLPFDDNSSDPIDRLLLEKKKRAYYLLPSVEEKFVEMKLRTLDSYTNITKLRSDLEVEDFQDLDIAHLIPQTDVEKNSGELVATYVYGKGYRKKTALVKFTGPKKLEIVTTDLGKNVDRNNLSRFRSTEDKTYSDDLMFVRLYKRDLLKIGNTQVKRSFTLKSEEWANPIVGTVEVFSNSDSRDYFIESRYKVFSVKEENGKVISKQALPVNRESSYPGLSFSQSFQGVKLGNGNVGVFTDTKSIYGETVSVMTEVENEFIRPVKLNILTKKNCVSLGQSEMNGKTVLQMHCTNGKGTWIERQELSI